MRVTLPLVGMVTVCEPLATPKSPVATIESGTVSGEVGAGVADSVSVTLSPSTIDTLPLVIPTCGSGGFVVVHHGQRG